MRLKAFIVSVMIPAAAIAPNAEVEAFCQFKERARIFFEIFESDAKFELVTRLVWETSGGDERLASLLFCVGVRETRYKLEEVRDGHVSFWGCRKETWKKAKKAFPEAESYCLRWFLKVLEDDGGDEKKALMTWVAGRENWKNDPKERKRAERYAEEVLALRELFSGRISADVRRWVPSAASRWAEAWPMTGE